MTALSRRRFMQAAGGLATAWALSVDDVARVLAAAPAAGAESDIPTTLDRRIVRVGSQGKYDLLGYGPGESFAVRDDLGITASSGRAGTRRSLLFFGQYSDTHIKDTQSPAAPHSGENVYIFGAGDAYRPMGSMTNQVLNEMIRAMNGVPASPVTGASMGFSVITGDLTDQSAYGELRWIIDQFDGKTITPNTGDMTRYQGIEAWGDAQFGWHPDATDRWDWYSDHDFPRYPGLMNEVIKPFDAEGSDAPWYCVFGNHDVDVWQGFLPNWWIRDMLAESGRKEVSFDRFASLILLSGFDESPQWWRNIVTQWWNNPSVPGSHTTTPDEAARDRYSADTFMTEMFRTEAVPGPVGHGFTNDNLVSGDTHWMRVDGPFVHLALDSCNHESGSEGSLHRLQFEWLEEQLSKYSQRYYDTNGDVVENPLATDKLVIVYSHHNSWTMTNSTFDPNFPYSRRFGWDVVALLRRYPNCIAWVNGHSHVNRIKAHQNPWEPGAGFWEINAASCIDFPQQNRAIEVVDNRDGTISLFTFVLDHAADPRPTGSFTPSDIASLSRELAVNDPFRWGIEEWFSNPTMDQFEAAGDPEDRNCELFVKAPFDLEGYADAGLEAWSMGNRVRQLARDALYVT